MNERINEQVIMNIKKKCFCFGRDSFNDQNVSAINQWLMNGYYNVESLKIQTAHHNYMYISETVLVSATIIYKQCLQKECIFQLGFFTSNTLVHFQYAKVIKKLKKWEAKNRDKKIMDVQYYGDNVYGSETVFFLYKLH